MKIKVAAILVAVSLMLVGGCSDPHANMHCVSTHVQFHTHPIYGYHTTRTYSPKTKRWTTTSHRYLAGYGHSIYNVCDHWVHN